MTYDQSRLRIVVRPMRPDEGHTFLDVQSRSVRGLASGVYPPEVIAAWAQPPTTENLRRFAENVDEEIRLIAEVDGVPVGLGALVLRNSELRACYVVPEAARKGVGTAIVNEMERIARANNIACLELYASVNAESFYATFGYGVITRGEHVLRSGERMAAVKMRKILA
jgi:putative acetyltransferase